jgi:hypothetical protein
VNTPRFKSSASLCCVTFRDQRLGEALRLTEDFLRADPAFRPAALREVVLRDRVAIFRSMPAPRAKTTANSIGSARNPAQAGTPLEAPRFTSEDPSGWCFRNLELDAPGIFFFGQVR